MTRGFSKFKVWNSSASHTSNRTCGTIRTIMRALSVYARKRSLIGGYNSTGGAFRGVAVKIEGDTASG